MNAIVGMPLDAYKEVLHPVAEEFNGARSVDAKLAWDSFDGMKLIGKAGQAYVRYWHGSDDENDPLPPFNDVVRNLPLKALGALSFDQLCKIQHSSLFMLSESVREVFDKPGSPEHHLMFKLGSSMWRWGMNRALWNDTVASHRGIKSFDLGIPGFEVRLDHTTHVNEIGYSEYSRTFLDGVFAYLIYWRGEHVMTLGFSIMDGRRVLIQQIQTTKRRGNRFLYRWPANRVEYVIERFAAAFPDHTLYIADGADIGQRSLKSYRSGITHTKEAIQRMVAPGRDDAAAFLAREVENLAKLREKAKHLNGEIDRLRDYYRDTGRFTLGEAMTVNGIRHYEITV